MEYYKIIQPGSFEPEHHWYPKALNATVHPMMSYFLNLSTQRVVERYCHLHPRVDKDALMEIIVSKPKYFRWAGADLINVTNADGKRMMVVIENNSCPSGQKSMPLLDDMQEYGGYKKLIENTFLPILQQKSLVPEGVLAVLYDKNPMEASGYASVISDLTQEKVYYIHFPNEGWEEYIKIHEGVLKLKLTEEEWIDIKAAFRYVTQKPWNRMPVATKTKILNPIISCIAGGRNKIMAAKAYELYNAEIESAGLKINIPETIWDVSQNEVPIWVKKMGGQAVVKVPYSNAGQGVFTIVSQRELNQFMEMDFEYDQFIVQSLIGNYHWSSTSSLGKLYHVGTIPNNKNQTYVADIRMMVGATEQGIRPICAYSRRAKEPLQDRINQGEDSWDSLGTNLSYKLDDGSWASDTHRLILMDRRDFNKLGIGVDDLIEAYIQTVLSMTAIDNMAQTLMNSKGKLRRKLFSALNHDAGLLNEMLV
ncbi:MAG TPA: hypothetical protein PKC30_13945 [Saprospiraceae bacterium]|nr:hypothetical protein [Saprospiraceae bacterium]